MGFATLATMADSNNVRTLRSYEPPSEEDTRTVEEELAAVSWPVRLFVRVSLWLVWVPVWCLFKIGEPVGEVVAMVRALRYMRTYVDLASYNIDRRAPGLVPYELAKARGLIPILDGEDSLVVAMSDPTDRETVRELRDWVRNSITVVIASPAAIAAAIETHYHRDDPVQELVESVGEVPQLDEVAVDRETPILGLVSERPSGETRYEAAAADDSTVAKLANLIVLNAVEKEASHIYIEATCEELAVSYRLEDRMVSAMRVPGKCMDEVRDRILFMAGLDLEAQDVSQEGVVSLGLGNARTLSLHVSTVPTARGGDITMRVIKDGTEPRVLAPVPE